MECKHKNLISNSEIFKRTGNKDLIVFIEGQNFYAKLFTCLDCGIQVAKVEGGIDE